MNKCNKTSSFPILKQYYIKFSFIFIIYSNKKSLSVYKYINFFVFKKIYLYW